MSTSLLATVIDFVLRLSTLADNTHAMAPRYLSMETAYLHAIAAAYAATDEVPADILLGMAFVESRYIPEATSRVENGVRTTGVPKWTTPPKNVTGPYFCGVTQADARFSWQKCQSLRNIFVAYKTTVDELTKWLKICDGKMSCALTGYGGGFPAIKAGTSTYPARVMTRARFITRVSS